MHSWSYFSLSPLILGDLDDVGTFISIEVLCVNLGSVHSFVVIV